MHKIFDRRRPDKTDSLAQGIAMQIVFGTLPEEGVIACPDEESAKKLLEKIKYYTNLYSGLQ